ncbi:MAG: hypothetical protein ABSD75_03075 [Terriglobales bacterium]|jgi:hypothetical protein
MSTILAYEGASVCRVQPNGDTVHVSLDEIFGNHFGEWLRPDQRHRTKRVPRHRQGRPRPDNATPVEPVPFQLGFASIDEGTPGRRLNGDENDQGNSWRFDARSIKIEKAVLDQYL